MLSRIQAVAMVSVTAALGFTEFAHGQTATGWSGENNALARAIALHDSAVAMYNQPARSAEAARLHLEEVRFRSWSDPEAVDALVMAANLFNYANQPLTAKKVMERAAERAIAIGDVLTAAQAFTNAAFLAHKVGSTSETQRLGRKAVLLSQSPLIDPQQRTAIRNRLTSDPAIAGLVK